jgi:hypothetical protein
VNRDMQTNADDLRKLEEQLRRLPPPMPSPDLEQRLLCSIPEIKADRIRPWRRTRWLGAFAAAAALLFGVALLRWDRNQSPPDAAPRHSPLLNDTSPRLVLGATISSPLQETRPCDILPPFPNS